MTPGECEEARKAFLVYDADGDGVVSRSDFAAAMARHDPSFALPSKAYAPCRPALPLCADLNVCKHANVVLHSCASQRGPQQHV